MTTSDNLINYAQPFILLIIIVMTVSCGQKKTQQRKPADTVILNKTIENIVYDLNNDQLPDTICLSQDTGTVSRKWFDRITISLSGYGRRSFKAQDGWEAVDTNFLKRNNNFVHSENAFIYRDSIQADVLLFGTIFGAETGKSTVISIKNNVIKKLFDKSLDYLTQLTDLNNDGIVELVGKSHSELYEQTSDADILTYDPFFVYSLDGQTRLNLQLMRDYNQEHYVWAGFKAPDKIKVRHPHDGGKPTIVK
jgi:hypothetical protein